MLKAAVALAAFVPPLAIGRVEAEDKRPAPEFRTTPGVERAVSVTLENVPEPAVPPPIAPGEAKVAPLSKAALRLETSVFDETVKGAVPEATVETNVFAVMLPETTGDV